MLSKYNNLKKFNWFDDCFCSYHIPDIRIVTVEPLRAGKPVELILKFTNPTQHQTDISFLELVITEPEDEEVKETEESLDSLSLQDVRYTIV